MMVIRTSVSISIKVIFLLFITMNYGLTHSMNKIMKKKNEVVFSFAVFTLEKGQAIIHGDKEQKDYFYGYGGRRPYYHHHYYGDNNNNDDWRVWGETDNNKDHFYNGDH